MPIPIKIQCGCGQHYAFDVETASRLGPNSVACPVCGADGTAVANVVIVQNLSAAPSAAAVVPTESSRLHLAVSSSPTQTIRAMARLAGQMLQVDPEKAGTEARAKMIWGDSPETVTSFLRVQGFSKEDASALVRETVQQGSSISPMKKIQLHRLASNSQRPLYRNKIMKKPANVRCRSLAVPQRAG